MQFLQLSDAAENEKTPSGDGENKNRLAFK